MKNILILIDMLESLSGGAERHIMELCKNIDRSKYNPIIACLSDKDGLLKDISNYGIKTASFKVKRIYDLFGILKGLKFITFAKRERIDVLITYHFGSDIWGTIFGKLAGIKVIMSSRRDLGFWKLRHHDLAYRIINHWVDKIIAVSESVKEEIINRERVAPEKVEVIYNGVNLDYFNKKTGSIIKRNESPIVGVISWIRHEKGIDFFLRAAAKVNERSPNTKFVIVGDGPEKDKMISLARQLNIEKNVNFLGWRLDIPKILKTFDILVSPAFTEGFSNTVIEAMASRKPVIATAIGGNREAISNNETGILIAPKDTNALSNAILYLLNDEDKRKEMGNAAYNRVKEKFEISKTIKKIQREIDNVFYAKNKMYIPAFPSISLSNIIKGLQKKHLQHISSDDGIIYTYCGSCAIYKGVKALGFNANDNILMPSYHCGVEIDMVLKAGVNIKFYNINDDMSIDIEDIKEKIDKKTKGIYVIYYFGYIEPMEEIRNICTKKKMVLIEDCAHVMIDLNSLQQKKLGDFQIFSFIKTLPVADGGALVVSNRDMRIETSDKKSAKSLVFSKIMLSLSETVRFKYRPFHRYFDTFIIKPLRFGFRLMKKISHSEATKMLREESREFYKRISDNSISNLSLNIIKSTNYTKDTIKRRENFMFLLQNIKKIKNITALYKSLPEDVTPLFFPILTETRDILKENLAKRGVQTFIFGKNLHSLVSTNDFIFSKKLSDNNLCLPIHQGLDIKHMEYILYVLMDEVEKINNKETKILHLISSNGLFGAEKVMLNLASNMNCGGVKSWIAAVKNSHNPHTEITDIAKKRNIPVFTIESRGRFDLKAVSVLYNFIKGNNIDILYTHNFKADFLGLLSAKKARIPIVATLHGYIGSGLKLKLYELLDRFILRFFDKVIFVDDSLKKQFKNNTINATVINNGVDVSGDTRYKTQEHKTQDTSRVLTIGTVGRLSEEKGHKYLLEAFSRVFKEYPDMKLIIIGDGELRKELEDLSISLGIKENVDFVGNQNELSKYYSLMDIYVSSSLIEHFPMAVLEAMGHEKAIVATDVGGTPNLIKNRKTGLLINPASSGDIYNALLTFIKDVNLRKNLGKNAKHFAKDNYSLEKMVNSYKKVYEEALTTK